MSFHDIVLIFLAAIVAETIGFLWYSPMFLGPRWERLKGLGFRTKSERTAYRKKRLPAYLLAFVSYLVVGWTLWAILGLLGVSSVQGALLFATIVWAGVALPITFMLSLFDDKPLSIWAIDIGNVYASMLAIAIVLSVLS